MKKKSCGELLLMRLAGDLRRGVPAPRLMGQPSHQEDVKAFCRAVDLMVLEDDGQDAAAMLIEALDFSRKVGRPRDRDWSSIAEIVRRLSAVEDYINEKASKARYPRRWKLRGGADGAMERVAKKHDIKLRTFKEWYTQCRRAFGSDDADIVDALRKLKEKNPKTS